MKQYTHAWLALKAVGLLKSYEGKFSPERNKRLKRFTDFISQYPDTFVRGAWFPDTVISDNTQGGHTWKYYINSDSSKNRSVSYRPPTHNKCATFVKGELKRKVCLDTRTSDLPDRCEALGQTIRDTVLITNKLKKGDVMAYSNTQVAIFFLMLSHYITDAHVPPHCDKRDFYDPSHIHPDLEDLWEDEIIKYYKLSKKTRQFDLDEDGNLQKSRTKSGKEKKGYKDSLLGKCDALLNNLKWANMTTTKKNWRVFLGKKNNNFWDYLVSVCLVSFHLSRKMFPPTPPGGVSYQTVRIKDQPKLLADVKKYSPYILADAISSVALLWLAAWERWELLKEGER